MSSVSTRSAATSMDPKERRITEAAMRLFHRHGYRKVTMMDIAAESGMSRPSLYAAFANKEAVFSALMDDHCRVNAAKADAVVAGTGSLRAKLEALFEIWILEPFASVAGSENGADLLANSTVYAPEASTALYHRFREQLLEVLKPEMAERGGMSAGDLAHFLMMAVRGLKATTATEDELRRLTTTLIAMAEATANA